MQKHANLVDLVKSFPTNIFLQNLASIQKRTGLIKFAHLAEKPEKGSISNLSTKVWEKLPVDRADCAIVVADTGELTWKTLAAYDRASAGSGQLQLEDAEVAMAAYRLRQVMRPSA